MTEQEACFNFKPDPDHINALPRPLRSHIHDLATRTDPTGDIQQIASLLEQRNALVLKTKELEARVLARSPIVSDSVGDLSCYWCSEWFVTPEAGDNPENHEPDCLWAELKRNQTEGKSAG